MTEALLIYRAPLFSITNTRCVFTRPTWPGFARSPLTGCAAPATLSKQGRRRLIKTVHALLQTLVGVFIVLAIVFAEEYKADQHGAHFWSVHAWIGAGAIALYCLQYPLGNHTAGALLLHNVVLHPLCGSVAEHMCAQGSTSM